VSARFKLLGVPLAMTLPLAVTSDVSSSFLLSNLAESRVSTMLSLMFLSWDGVSPGDHICCTMSPIPSDLADQLYGFFTGIEDLQPGCLWRLARVRVARRAGGMLEPR
jgi:hypothetical protein